MKLKGRVAIMTGAASGIGKASPEIFAREGAKVVLADDTQHRLHGISVRGIGRSPSCAPSKAAIMNLSKDLARTLAGTTSGSIASAPGPPTRV